ncbi:uncharacterized protein [Macaca nemestrina]|uniref:uncharacterized protein isoform X2 n=1 Tax=Macaca nemestrina TaxID=9545 RepID=UPI0039B9C9CB
MEILDEFDSEVPQSETFCQQISEEDLERRSVVQGELNHCNSTGALEMHERVKQLKQSIHRMHPYSRDTKKRRRKPRQKKPEPILLRDQLTSPCLPPTPLPPLPLPPPWSPW